MHTLSHTVLMLTALINIPVLSYADCTQHAICTEPMLDRHQ